jgi:hypothetical protein
MFPNVAKIGSGNYRGNISWNINQNKPPPTLPKGWKGGKVEHVFYLK